MNRVSRRSLTFVAALFVFLFATASFAQSPQQFAPDATRYMALGDSIAAGYEVMPVTNGYPFLLYQDGVFDRLPHTLFNDAAVPGATSADVLHYQVPQALIPSEIGGFNAKYLTVTVGGNDLLAILTYAATHSEPEVLAFAQQTIVAFGQNLAGILVALRTGLPDAKIFVSNQYTIPEIQAVLPFTDTVVDSFNGVVAQVVAQVPNVYLVDVHAAFLGRNNLIAADRPYAPSFAVHPTNVGQRVIEKAFADVIEANR